MSNKKLKNVSTRTFQIGESTFVKPGESFTTDAANAEHLMGLYPDELMDYAAESAKLDAAGKTAAPETDYEKMTVKELREHLKAAGIAFEANAPKADLVKLAKGSTGEAAPAAESTVTEPTVLADDTQLVEGTVYTADGALYVGKMVMEGDAAKVKLAPVDSLTADERAALVEAGKLAA